MAKVTPQIGLKRGFWNAPVLTCLGIIVFTCTWAATSGIVAGLSLVAIAASGRSLYSSCCRPDY